MSFDELERRASEIARHRENRGRLAQAYARFRTTGQGRVVFEERVDFGLIFVERPYLGYGAEIDLDALGELLDLDVRDDPSLPDCTGFVTEWDVTDRGFYVGAWCAAKVTFPPEIPSGAALQMFHHFTFSATAIKDVDPELSE